MAELTVTRPSLEDTYLELIGETAMTTADPAVHIRVGVARGGVELKQFFRQKEQVVFTFTFPAIILVLLGSIFDGTYPPGVTVGQVFAASMIAAGVVATSFLNLGISVALDREDGTLKRLRGTPMTAVVLLPRQDRARRGREPRRGRAAAGRRHDAVRPPLPTEAARWFTFAWVFVLRSVPARCSASRSARSRSPRRAPAAVANVPYIALQFMSGVYIPDRQRAGVDAHDRVALPDQVGGAGVPLGVPTGQHDG